MFTVLTKITINAELEKRPELKAKENANSAKDKLQEKLKHKESGLKEKLFKAKAKVTKGLKDDLKKGDTKHAEKTVPFIRLASKTRQNTIPSNKTVLVQRIPEYEAKQDAPTQVGDESKEQAQGGDQKKVDLKVMQGAS